MRAALIFIVSAYVFISCEEEPKVNAIPSISFVHVTDDTMFQSSKNIDSTFVVINFEDTNGDIGGKNSKNIVLIDKRTGEFYDSFSLPELPQANRGVRGEIAIRLFTTCCIFPENIPPCERPQKYPSNSLVLDIYMMDEAGNKSNQITTTPITLLCN